jgi:uncharacterized membrane protein YkvA (DUF1232 family)
MRSARRMRILRLRREGSTMHYRYADASGCGANDEAQAWRDEDLVRRGFLQKAMRVAAKLPFAEDLVAAYYCAFDRNTPRQVRVALIGALAYFVLPFDAMPDMMLALGFADDAAVLATVIRLVASHISPTHRVAARRALDRLAR